MIFARAVAENQPDVARTKNRMTSELSNFAARLRELINSQSRVTRGPDLGIRGEDGDSYNSSLRTDDDFNVLARELFALQFTHNAAYRRLCEARRNSPQTLTRWSNIPAVPTAAFKELELTCLPPEERTVVFHSSGTTEYRQSRHFHGVESLAVYEASSLAWFRRHVSSGGDLLILTPPLGQAAHSSLVRMFETVRRDFGAPNAAFVGEVNAKDGWTLDFEGCLNRLQQVRESEQPLVLLGTAFSFVHLLDFLAEQDLQFQLPRGSRVMETGGYKGRSRDLPKAELHALIEERLGVPASHIVCEYGMSELSSQAYDKVANDECQVKRSNGSESCHPSPVTCHFRFPPWVRAQIISPETEREVADGETGLIRVFDLANVFSVLAIQTEDLGIRRGDGFELIGRAEFAEPRGCSLTAV
jgi:hypothetical protein